MAQSPDPSPSEPLDLVSLVQDGRHFAEVRGTNTHVIDSLSGVTVAIFPTNPTTNAPTGFVRTQKPDGTSVLAPNGVDLTTGVVADIYYSPLLLDIICQKLAEGGSLTQICKEKGMPSYNTLCRWRRKHPEVAEALELARQDRAENMRDKALDEALQANDKNDAPAQALKYDAYKWAAGVDDQRYSPKAKIEASITHPTQIIVNTGIVRDVPQEVPKIGVADGDG